MLVRSSAILALFVSSAMAFAPPTANVVSTTTTRLAANKLNDDNTMDDRRSFVTKVGAGMLPKFAKANTVKLFADDKQTAHDNVHCNLSPVLPFLVLLHHERLDLLPQLLPLPQQQEDYLNQPRLPRKCGSPFNCHSPRPFTTLISTREL